MSLEDKLSKYRRKALIEFLQDNPNMQFGELFEGDDDEVLAILTSLTFADFFAEVGEAPGKTKTKTKTKTKAKPRASAPRFSAAHINSEFMRWRDAQDVGSEFTMRQIQDATGLSPQQIKSAMSRLGGLEKRGAGPGTTYTVYGLDAEEDEDFVGAGSVNAEARV